MNILRSVTIAEVEAEFLKTEWYKEIYDSIRKQYDAVVHQTNFNDEKNNSIRHKLLWDTRQPLLEKLPVDVRWYELSLTPQDFSELLIIKGRGWGNTFAKTKKIKEVAELMQSGIPDRGINFSLIYDIKKQIGTYNFKERFILIALDINGPYTILEGNHRTVAFQLYAMENHNLSYLPKTVILGTSPSMSQTPWLNIIAP